MGSSHSLSLLLLTTIITILLTICASNSNFILADAYGDETFSHELWNSLLQRYVAPSVKDGIPLNVVNYAAFRRDPDFITYLGLLETVDIGSLTYNDTLAFYINAYNAMAIKMVAGNPCKTRLGKYCWPITSIRDISGRKVLQQVWDMPIGKLKNGTTTTTVTLGGIEAMLRSLKDPRIHAAIVCASISCPDLLAGSYEADTVSDQLDAQMASFLANGKKGYTLDRDSKTMTLSRIFEWYQSDFVVDTGLENIQQYVARFLSTSDAEFVLNTQDLRIKYFDYDWRLNSNI